MASPEHVNQKPVVSKKNEKPDFSGFLRAINVDRLNPANNPEKPLLLKQPLNAQADKVMNVRLLQATGILVSAIWLVGAAVYVQRMVGWSNVSGLMPHEMGGFLAGILTPIALFWMIAAFILRSNDVKMYAEALREEIQGMMFPSDEANRRVNNDIERLMRQTAEMSKATRIALSAIETAREGLKNQVNLMNDGSAETVERLSKLGDNLNTRMQDAATMGAQLEASLAKIEQSAGAAEAKLGTSREHLENSAKSIDQSTQNTEQAVARLSQLLRDRLESLGDLHQETEAALKNAASEIALQRAELRIDAEGLEQQAYAVGDALLKGADKLYNFTDDALDKAKLIEMKLLAQTESLQNVLSQVGDNTNAIDTVTTNAIGKLEIAGSDIKDHSTRIEDILQNAVSRLEDRAQATVLSIKEGVEGAASKFDDVATRVSDSADNIQQEVEDAVARLIEEMATAENRVETVGARAVDTVNTAKGQMEQATEKLISDVDAVGQRAKDMSQEMLGEVSRKVSDTTAAFAYIQTQIQSLVGLFDQRKLQLDETGISARQTAEAMQTTLQNALDKVQQTAGLLHSGIGAIQVSVTEPILLLENAANMAHQRAGDITQILNSQTDTMIATSQKLGEEVTNAQHNLYSKNQDIALLAGKIAMHLKTVGQELETQNNLLDSRLNKSVQVMETLNDTQKQVSQNLESLQQQTKNTAVQSQETTEEIQQKINLLQQLHKSLADDAASSKGELDRVSDRLITISTSTVDKIKNSIENMTLLEADYHRLSDAGIDAIETLSEGYRDTLANVRKETQETVEMFTSLQSGLEDKTQSVNAAMEEQLANLQATAGNLNQTVSKVHDFGDTLALHSSRISDIGQRFTSDNEKISIHVQSVKDAVSQIKDYTIEAVDSFMQQGQNLEQQMHSQMSRLNDVNQDFIANNEKTKDLLNKTVTETQTLTATIEEQVGRMTSVNKDMAQQREAVEESGTEILNRLTQATQQISNQAAELEKAAQLAQQQAEELRAQERKLNQEAFFNSTKFIVESLHSLALDFTRMLEGELNEKTWRGYQKGDVGSFTRRLLSTRDEETQNKIRTKFKDDVEFRTYVQRYLRQFEEIYDSADQNDHANLLTSIFMTSDVGKLYQFVCTVLDREARGK